MNQKSIDILKRLADSALSATSEKIFLIEYIMNKYTFVTSQTPRERVLNKGEVEYILYANDLKKPYDKVDNSQIVLISKALSQVWIIRFSIDAIDKFVTSSIAYPPYRIGWSLVEGAYDASSDVYRMLKGETIKLFPHCEAPIQLKYSDHLRLILLMKSEDEILRKVKELMQAEISSPTLSNYSTKIKVSGAVKINLLFIPVFQVDKLFPNSFVNGQYIIKKETIIEY